MDFVSDEKEFLELAEIEFIIRWNNFHRTNNYRQSLNCFLENCKELYRTECINKNRGWKEWMKEK